MQKEITLSHTENAYPFVSLLVTIEDGFLKTAIAKIGDQELFTATPNIHLFKAVVGEITYSCHVGTGVLMFFMVKDNNSIVTIQLFNVGEPNLLGPLWHEFEMDVTNT